ncbi:MAG: hypothetical protein WA902_13035 [Thermosynechococcaceae cyanobacterium]
MKIIQDTPDILVLQEKLMGLWFLGLGTAAFGFFVVLSFESPMDLFGGVCIAVSALVATLSPTETCSLNKINGLMTLRQQNWFKHRIKQQSIQQVADVNVEAYRVMGAQFFRVNLVLKSGQVLLLTRSASTDRAMQQDLAQRIEAFLGLEPSDIPMGAVTP